MMTQTHLDRLTMPETQYANLLQQAVAFVERGKPSAQLFKLFYLWHWVELAYWLHVQKVELERENDRLRALVDQAMAWPVEARR